MKISGQLHFRFRTHGHRSQNLGPNSGFSIFSSLGCRICSILRSQLENHDIVSSPPTFVGGDGGSAKSGKLGGKRIPGNNWGGRLSWGGSKITGGDG